VLCFGLSAALLGFGAPLKNLPQRTQNIFSDSRKCARTSWEAGPSLSSARVSRSTSEIWGPRRSSDGKRNSAAKQLHQHHSSRRLHRDDSADARSERGLHPHRSAVSRELSRPSWTLYQLAYLQQTLGVAKYTEYQPPFGDIYPIQLASYTMDTQGNLVSTNTWANMPTPAVNVTTMNMSPSGKFLAVAGNSSRSFSVGPTAPPDYRSFTSTGRLRLRGTPGSSPQQRSIDWPGTIRITFSRLVERAASCMSIRSRDIDNGGSRLTLHTQQSFHAGGKTAALEHWNNGSHVREVGGRL
jgi:hypothetical protein